MKEISLLLFSLFKRNQSNVIFSSVKYKSYSVEKLKSIERKIEIRTCGGLYRKWKEEKRFRKLPEDDLVFNIPFIDTLDMCPDTSNMKRQGNVLALHGAPGSWKDFSNISTFLHQQGYRVIVPSFPDFSIYKPGIFRHSDEEKALYLEDFLKALSISNIDLLICHSSSVYPGLNVCLNNEHLSIKALAMLNPGTFSVKGMSSTKQIKHLKAFVKASENPVLLKLMEVFGPFFLKNFARPIVSFESILGPLLSATTMVHAHIPQSKEKFLQVSQKLPVLCMFSENDPLIGMKASYELATLLGAHNSSIFKYDKNGEVIQEGKATNMLKVIVFQGGSHYAFWKHPEIVQKEIINFLLQQKQKI